MNIVITGASRGIGAGLADHYRGQGHEVIGTGRSVASQLQLDVTRPVSHREMAEALDGHAIDLLVCNAGVYLDKGNDLDTGYGADLWAQSFATNVTGVFMSIQALLPHLRRAKGAKIAIISSQMGSDARAKSGGSGGSYIYRASKAAALNLGLNLANDLKVEGIAVGIYHPGWVQTDMGGGEAEITTDAAVEGLVTRFAALSLENTGCFENWDGRPHAF
ncbi:SDR family NAD(P)-dependent oxidoreductase [Sulfitobacter sp. M57]|uniref:SDR family NAD(P)-dependent oxidoreductase n=1 Tax=unclassified Sulfitobacter TaxID=196795 RepID=UPI0023E2205A|nr:MULTISPECIES: SDR family NAD(P)-dependent oxidoreductase [unclassified Sulfitobacter]MDF3413008.1 SDR family NAD(P)-dependent oxidoreductase [Sulfitobacter sp. KE5]MDF3421708.1 SDR family NAD(P)-dependent oxidoreductase [Sulfitobacter sp. KE43]MDF3431557.1 SDR family NAD(P)-dependent oxidoreductase [Sulfitobacter sp. KE42]MDF3457198.1 SDR family NAD(P)-dependent oxidoreductase [Sulfitobacter sp. S74]MDF3461101.1 SDR family NAD(P)-dependent oxidoreductase [Sulfitobacter sp. Ks18]